MQSIFQLSPPWYTLWNKIHSSIGNAPGILVQELDTSAHPYSITLTVEDRNRAVAIASILTPYFDFDNIGVKVIVTDKDGDQVPVKIPRSADELIALIETALGQNRWFQKVESRHIYPGSPNHGVYSIFSRAVIQFFNDDLRDYYSNFNQVVAVVFQDIFLPSPGGIFHHCSTSPSAYFRFSDADNRLFVIELTDPGNIEHARSLLRGDVQSPSHIRGKIVKESVPYNPAWSFHIDPESIEFFEKSVEVCDASIQFVEDNLKDVCGSTLPNCEWCPWTSRLVDEIILL
ncbi:MAG: hypothetical protein AAF587_28450 [Bacteroidota bacterium]